MKELFHYAAVGEPCGTAYPGDEATDDSPEQQTQPRDWSFFKKTKYQEPSPTRISEINEEPLGRERVIKAVMYGFELAGIVKSVDDIRALADDFPLDDAEDDAHPTMQTRRDGIKKDEFYVEEATYNAIYEEVVEITDRLEEVPFLQKTRLIQQIPNPYKIPVLNQIDMMSKPHKNPRTKDWAPVILNENTGWQAVLVLRIMIAARMDAATN